MVALVRIDLHDEDAAAYRWTDATLERHIERVVTEYSHHVPLELTSDAAITNDTRDVDISALTRLIDVQRAEYPPDEWPKSFVGFGIWGDTLTLDVDSVPADADTARLYYNAEHLIDGSGSTVLAAHDPIIAKGAAGYAMLDRSSFAADRLNTGGEDAWGRYRVEGDKLLAEYRADLRTVGRKGALQVRRSFTVIAPDVFHEGTRRS